ncbi:DUF6893 family small protein [Streptomyces tagetis]
MKRRLIGGAAAAATATGIALIAANVWPDLLRYLRIRRM